MNAQIHPSTSIHRHLFTLVVIDDRPNTPEQYQKYFQVDKVEIMSSLEEVKAFLDTPDPFRLFILDLSLEDDPTEDIGLGIEIFEWIQQQQFPFKTPLIYSGHADTFRANYQGDYEDDRVFSKGGWQGVDEKIRKKLSEDMSCILEHYCVSTLTIDACYVTEMENPWQERQISFESMFDQLSGQERELLLHSLLTNRLVGNTVWPLGNCTVEVTIHQRVNVALPAPVTIERFFSYKSTKETFQFPQTLAIPPYGYNLDIYSAADFEAFMLEAYPLKSNTIQNKFHWHLINYHLVQLLAMLLLAETDGLERDKAVELIDRFEDSDWAARYLAILLWEQTLVRKTAKSDQALAWLFSERSLPKVYTGYYARILSVEGASVLAEVKTFEKGVSVVKRLFDAARLQHHGLKVAPFYSFRVINLWLPEGEQVRFEPILPASYDLL